MIRIDDSLLEEIGLISLPKPDRDQMLRQIYETLEMRVGMRLAERMTDQQLDEFERFIDTNDEAGALKWLESNFPDYKQVVADELGKLKEEIKKDSSRILEAMRTQPQQPTVAQPVQQNPVNPAQAQYAPTPQPQATTAVPPASQPAPANFGPAPQPMQSQQPFQPVSPPAPMQPTTYDQSASQSAQPYTQQPMSQNQPSPQPPQPQDDSQVQPQTSQNVPPPPAF